MNQDEGTDTANYKQAKGGCFRRGTAADGGAFTDRYQELRSYYTLAACGFGKKRLLRFFDEMVTMVRDDLDFYNFSHDSDAVWLYKRNLKEIGIDLDSLRNPFLEKLDIDVK